MGALRNGKVDDVRSKWALWMLVACAFLAIWCHEYLSAGNYISVSSSPSVTVTSSDLASGAGTDLTDTKVVPTTQRLDVTIPFLSGNVLWEVDVFLNTTTANWPSNVAIYAKRTSNGGNANVSGGTSNILLTTSPQTFFTGRYSASNVTVQYTITGLALANCPPSATYSYPIRYNFGLP